jgi:hypothetical protein
MWLWRCQTALQMDGARVSHVVLPSGESEIRVAHRAISCMHLAVMLARVLSAAVNGIEAFPVEAEVNSGWGDTVVVLIMSISPILESLNLKTVCEEIKFHAAMRSSM